MFSEMEESYDENGNKMMKHPSGLTFTYNPTSRGMGVKGKMFGTLPRHAQFYDAESLKARIDDLHVFNERPVFYQKDGGFETIESHKQIYNVDTGEPINILTKDYQIVQNKELFGIFSDTCENLNLQPVGNISVMDKGFTMGYVNFFNPEFTINLMEGYDEPVALGVEFRNSFNGAMGVAGQVYGIQTICSNLVIWGDLMNKFWIAHDHKESISSIADITTAFVENIVKSSPVLRRVCSDAESDEISIGEAQDVLMGTSLPMGMIESIVADPLAYNVRLKNADIRSISMFQLYNCATCALSFRDSNSYRSTLSHTESALRLLTDKADNLIEAGRIRAKKYADQLVKQALKRDELKKKQEMMLQARRVA